MQEAIDYLNRIYGRNWSNSFQPWGNRIICHLTIDGLTRSAVGDNEQAAFESALKFFGNLA